MIHCLIYLTLLLKWSFIAWLLVWSAWFAYCVALPCLAFLWLLVCLIDCLLSCVLTWLFVRLIACFIACLACLPGCLHRLMAHMQVFCFRVSFGTFRLQKGKPKLMKSLLCVILVTFCSILICCRLAGSHTEWWHYIVLSGSHANQVYRLPPLPPASPKLDVQMLRRYRSNIKLMLH